MSWSTITKKGVIILCLFGMATGLVACTGKKTAQTKDTAAKNITYAYSEIATAGINGDPEKILKQDGKIYVIADEADGNTSVSRLYQLNADTKKAALVMEFNTQEDEASVGGVIQIEGNEITYWTLDASDKKKEIVVADRSGNIQKRMDISEYFLKDALVNCVYKSKKGNYAIYSEPQVTLVDEQGNKVAKVDAKGNLCGCAVSDEGKFIVASNTKKGVVACEINEQDGSITSDMFFDADIANGGDNVLCDGDEDYEYYLRGQSVLYGYDRKEKAGIPLIDYTASAMELTEAFSVVPVTKQQAIGIYYSGNDGVKLSAYRKVEPDKLKNKQKITIGGLWLAGNSEIVDRVAAFNKSNPEYEMEIKSYSNDNAIKQFNLDVASGNIPDILVLDEWSPVDEYIEMGMLENLYEYFDQDDEVSKEEILEPLRKAMEVDGKLYYLSEWYDVSTWIVPTDYVGNKIGWTLDECMEFVKKYPDASLFDFTDKSYVLYALTFNNLVDFVDWEQGKCYFDSKEFIDMLHLANTRGTNEEKNGNMDEDDRLEAYRNREILFQTVNWDGIDMIQSAKRIYGTDDVTMIGRPNREKNGSSFVFERVYGISSESKMKDAAWKFVKGLLMDYTTIRQDVFQEQMDWYRDSIGKNEARQNSDGSYSYASPTEEEIQQYIDLINRTNKVEWRDNNIYNIVEEEAKACFSGQRSEEETAKIIQTRVTTYMNEKK